MLAEWSRKQTVPPIRQPNATTIDHSASRKSVAGATDIRASGHLHVNLDGQTSFHGHTSIFDQPELQLQPQLDGVRPALTLPEDIARAESVLSEAAAAGRHQEIYDLAAGRLDFDGVHPELATELLHIHWQRQHHALLITYRPAFMRDMAVPGGGKYYSKL